MLDLDIRTLSFLTMLSSLLLALGLQIVHRVIARNPSLRLWAMGATATGIGFVLLALRSYIPDFLSIVIANTLIVVGAAWQYLGNREFQGRKSEFPWYWWLAAGTAALFMVFTYLTPNLTARIVVISAVIASFRFASAFVLLRPVGIQDRAIRWFIAGAYLTTAIFMIVRSGASIFVGPTNQNFMAAAGAIQTFSFVFEIGLNMVLGIGLPLLVLGRTHELLIAGEERYRTLIEWSPVPIAVHDGGKLVYANSATLSLFGASTTQDLIGKRVLDLVHPDFRKLVTERAKAGIDEGLANPIAEEKFLKLDGSVIDVEVKTIPIQYEGRPAVQVAMNDVTERKRMEDQIRLMAFHDPLTNLPNRRLFDDRLGLAMAACKRSGCFDALLFLDLDNFKPLNDTHGHEVGDLLLVEVARRLTSCVRQTDTVARFGGDEFVVMISELKSDRTGSTAEAGIIAEKIRMALSEPYLLTIKRNGGEQITLEHHCTASIGLTLFNGHEVSQEEVLKSADLAMYQAKDNGRNLISFSPETTQPTGSTLKHPQNLIQLVWHASYESGDTLIDEQHRSLFRACNELLNALIAGSSPTEVDELIEALMKDVGQHFSDEESIFLETDYPDSKDHIVDHRQLVDRASALIDRYHAGTLATGEFIEFLANDIVAQHIAGKDRDFFSYLKGRKKQA
ncbi:MAG: diguanylate cyclase [Sulfuritalea sp.]|nr:diguanylate cyclase [Sulfuritalea sp.]